MDGAFGHGCRGTRWRAVLSVIEELGLQGICGESRLLMIYEQDRGI